MKVISMIPVGNIYHRPTDSWIAIYCDTLGEYCTFRTETACFVPLTSGAYGYEGERYGQYPQIFPDTERNDDGNLPTIFLPKFLEFGEE